jgi:hypothetical protein
MRRHFDSRVTRFAQFSFDEAAKNLHSFDRVADLRGGAGCCSSLGRRILFRMKPAIR